MCSLPKGNRPKASSFGNDYGLYNELEEAPAIFHEPRMEMIKVAGPTSLLTIDTALHARTQLAPCKVVYEISDKQSPLACRSFSGPRSFGKIVCICIDGLRIVQDRTGVDAEYRINLTVDGRTIVSWKRYEQFRELGESFEHFCQGGLLLRRTNQLRKSLTCWREVQNHRPWLLRDVSVRFLQEESRLLESFLTSILHEFPTADLLLEFVAGTN